MRIKAADAYGSKTALRARLLEQDLTAR